MNCPDCLDLLQRQLDGAALPDRAVLDAHLAGCPNCREWFAAGQRLAAGLRALSPPRPPANLTDRIVVGVLAQRRTRQRRRWLAAGAAVAAALLVATVADTLWSGRGPQAPQPLVKREAKRDAEQAAPAVPSLRESVEEARSAVAALTDDLATKTGAQAKLLWNSATQLPNGPMPPLPDVGDLEEPLEPAAQSLRASGHGVSVSLQTVAGSAQRAFSYFLRELPLEPERKTGL